MKRAYSLLTIKAIREDERIIEGMATTPSPDRVGDIVEPLGAHYKLPMPLLWQHDSRAPVGLVEFAKATKDGIPFKARIEKTDEPGKLKERLDEAWQSVKLKLVRAVSIGFTINAYEILKEGGWRITDWEWLELSLVTIPANAEATISTVKSIDRAQLAATGNKQGTSKTQPGASGHRTTSQHKGTGTMKTLAERIAALEAEIAPKAERMKAIQQAADDDGERKLNESEAEEFDTLDNEVKELKTDLRRLKALNASASTAKAVDGTDDDNGSASRGARLPAEAKKSEEPGIGFARVAICLAVAKGNPIFAAEVAKHRYPGHKGIKAVFDNMIKAQVAGGTTGDANFAEALVDPTNMVSEFVELLRKRTILGRFGQGGIPSLRRVPFNIKVGVQDGSGTGGWVGQGKGIPVSRPSFTNATLRWTKVGGIIVMSKDLMRFSTPSAEMLVRDDLVQTLQSRLDSDFVNPSITETADTRPASITNGAQTYVSSLLDADGVRSEIKQLISYFIANDQPTSSGVFIMRDSQALSLSLMRNALGQKEFPDITKDGGLLEGFPVITSMHTPTGVVTLVNANDIYLADDGSTSLDMSDQAAIEMDTAPSNTINTGASPASSTEATMVSMFQTESVAIKATRIITWKRRRTTAVAYLTGASWGSAASSPPPAAI